MKPVLSDTTRRFLLEAGQENAYNMQSMGKSTPKLQYDLFKVLSMLEVALDHVDGEVIERVNKIAEWKQ